MSGEFRILVCGGRDYGDYYRVESVLNLAIETALKNGKVPIIIHGAAHGADSLAAKYALENNISSIAFRADWKTHGKAAGPIRNAKMLSEGRPKIIIAFPGGRGTADMVSISKKADIPVLEIGE